MQALQSQITMAHLIGVWGVLLSLRGERHFGWNENGSRRLSSTEGATYVKPYTFQVITVGIFASNILDHCRCNCAMAKKMKRIPRQSTAPRYVSNEELGTPVWYIYIYIHKNISYQESFIGTAADGCTFWAVHRRLLGELGVKLAGIIFRLLQHPTL